MTHRNAPGAGRPFLSPDSPTVKLEIMIPESLKAGIKYLAAMRSTQERRQVTVSEIVRGLIEQEIKKGGGCMKAVMYQCFKSRHDQEFEQWEAYIVSADGGEVVRDSENDFDFSHIEVPENLGLGSGYHSIPKEEAVEIFNSLPK